MNDGAKLYFKMMDLKKKTKKKFINFINFINNNSNNNNNNKDSNNNNSNNNNNINIILSLDTKKYIKILINCWKKEDNYNIEDFLKLKVYHEEITKKLIENIELNTIWNNYLEKFIMFQSTLLQLNDKCNKLQE